MTARPESCVVPRASNRPGPAAAAGVPRLSLAVLLAIGWALVVVQLLAHNWGLSADTLHDTDDAMRLVELRAFLAGQGWFDLHEARIAPPYGYDPHWSRLIDAGLAGLYLVFRPFADAAMAERLMRVVWPLLWLVPAMVGATATAHRLAGREAALVVLLCAVIGLPAYPQFAPGRIDHHNVQIALTLLALAATVWSDRVRWAAVAAGLVSALALAVGFECLPFLVLCGAALAVRFVSDPAAARPLAGYGLSLAAGTVLALAVDVPPARWTATACDMIAVNTAAAVIAGGVLLALAAPALARRGIAFRLVGVAVVGALALILSAALDPRCLGGPYAMMDPAVWPVWLSHVVEMQSWFALARDTPAGALEYGIFPAFALGGACVLGRDATLRRDFGWLVAFAAVVLAAALMLATVKMSSYAVWIAMPPAAVTIVRLCGRLNITGFVARATTALLLTPGVLAVTAAGVVHAALPAAGVDRQAEAKDVCFRIGSYAGLAKLPPGLVAAEIDYGPYLLALTPHTAIAGPYHRMSAPIVLTHRIFASPPDEARRLLAQAGARYVALCGPDSPAGMSDEARRGSLWGRLQAGDVPEWLERAGVTGDQPFAIYRVKPQG